MELLNGVISKISIEICRWTESECDDDDVVNVEGFFFRKTIMCEMLR